MWVGVWLGGFIQSQTFRSDVLVCVCLCVFSPMGHLHAKTSTFSFYFPIILFLLISILLTKLIKSAPITLPFTHQPTQSPWAAWDGKDPLTIFCMNIKCRICVVGLKLEITSLTNQLWRLHIQGLHVCVCACVLLCICVLSLVSSGNREPLHTETHKYTHPWPCCVSECLFSASAGSNSTHPFTITPFPLLQCIHRLAPI